MKCPRCDYLRQPTDAAPDWQCPACGVAYAKVARAGATTPAAASPSAAGGAAPAPRSDDDAAELHEQHALAARGQRVVILSIVATVVLRGVGQAVPGSLLAVTLLSCVVAVCSVWGLLRMCSGLGMPQGRKICFMVLAFFPLLNIVVLVYLSVRTTRLLRAAGWTVGLFGARA